MDEKSIRNSLVCDVLFDLFISGIPCAHAERGRERAACKRRTVEGGFRQRPLPWQGEPCATHAHPSLCESLQTNLPAKRSLLREPSDRANRRNHIQYSVPCIRVICGVGFDGHLFSQRGDCTAQ